MPSTSRPGRIIDPQRLTEHLPALAREEAPCDHQVAGGIAHAQAPEVDHGAQAAPFDQQVSGQQVSMDPDGRAVPFRRPRAASHAAVTASVSTIPCTAAIAARMAESRNARGTPRPAGGPSVGSILCRAIMNCATSVAAWRRSAAALYSRVLTFEPPLDGPSHG